MDGPATTWIRYTEAASSASETAVTTMTLTFALKTANPEAIPITAIAMNETMVAGPPNA
jgi:hypothetical protein